MNVWDKYGINPGLLNVTTTDKELFRAAESAKLAFLILKRFGNDRELAALKWSRMLGNDTPTDTFHKLALIGAEIEEHEERSYDQYRDPEFWR